MTLASFAAGEGEVFVDHVSISASPLHLLQPRAGLGQRQFQLQAGEGGAQVVADRGQKGGALVDVALDARLHVEEGLGGLAHLARAVRPEARDLGPLAESLGGGGETLDGAHLVADEQYGDGGQQEGCARQPHDEGAGLGGEGAVAGRQHPQHPLWQLHPDVDIGRVAGGVVPEGPVQPLGQGVA